jgi:hypothetical protein
LIRIRDYTLKYPNRNTAIDDRRAAMQASVDT